MRAPNKPKSKFYESFVSDMPEDSANVRHADDGSKVTYDGDLITLDLDDEEEHTSSQPDTAEFSANLADNLSEHEQVGLGQKLREFVETDLESRRVWEERIRDGLEIIGLQDIPDDAVAFEGAARASYPGVAEAMVQFQARAMEEFMPAAGPVKVEVVGKKTDELDARAMRVEEFMNYQLMDEDDEYYWETDDMLLYLPYAGSAFKKVGIDPILGVTRSRFVPASDFIVPYWAKSLQTAPRYTHRYTMTNNTFKRAVDSGYFVDADFPVGPPSHSTDTGRQVADVSDDRTESRHPDDQELNFYETTIDWEFKWEKHGKKLNYSLPYAITFEWETGRVVRIARVWHEDDPKCKKDVWFVHYKFLPGLGFYGWGYLHLIGGLGRAAGGALRLLLDGGALSSLQGGFKSRDARLAGDVSFSPATWQDVDMTAEELAKSFYTPPFKEPTPALFNVFKLLVENIQRFASTTENMVGEASNNGPVGTTLALIEQGGKVLSGIHKRLHAAAGKEFRLIAQSNFRYMETDEYPYDVDGAGRQVFRDDFGPEVCIVPVSDPNIFSNVQRIAQSQAMMQLIKDNPDIYTKRAKIRAHRNMLRALKIPDWDEYLEDDNMAQLDPVAENEAISTGVPVQVFRTQDDTAHMAVHKNYMQEVLALPPEVQQQIMPILQAHITAHFAQAYRKRMEAQLMQTTGVPLPPYDPNNLTGSDEDDVPLPPEMEAAISRAVAQFAPPPPPPPPPQPEDIAAQRDADRKDAIAKRDSDRKDLAHVADLRRKGLISDVPSGPELSQTPGVSPPQPSM